MSIITHFLSYAVKCLSVKNDSFYSVSFYLKALFSYQSRPRRPLKHLPCSRRPLRWLCIAALRLCAGSVCRRKSRTATCRTSTCPPVNSRLRARGALVGTAETLCRKYDNSRNLREWKGK